MVAEVKPFEGSALQGAIERQLLSLPEKAVTLTIDYLDGDKIKGAILGRIDKHWAFLIELDAPFHDKLEGHAAIQFGW